MLPAFLVQPQAHQGEEFAIVILPAAMLLGTWLIASWGGGKDRPSKDRPSSEDSLEPHQGGPRGPADRKS